MARQRTRDGEATGNADAPPSRHFRTERSLCTGRDQLPAESLSGGLVGFHQVGPRRLT